MKKIVVSCLFFLLAFFFNNISLYAVEDFYISGIAGQKEVTLPLTYSDKWFGDSPSTIYNHNIARVACLLSCVSYVDVLADINNNTLAKDLKILGVKEGETEYKYNINYNSTLYGNDQCAYTFAHKTIKEGKKAGRTLIFIIIRGTPLNSNEWLSNLNINNKENTGTGLHEGFLRAASQIHERLVSYLLRYKIDIEDACLLITGHSRGAAVSNLLSTMLLKDDFFKRENIYTYTFASPNVTTMEDAEEEKYSFIWNIVNPEDIVPTVPLYKGKWKYRKYGRLLTLINSWSVEQEEFEKKYLPRISDCYNSLIGRPYYPFKCGSFIPVQITDIVNELNGSVDDYYTEGTGIHKAGATLLTKLFSGSENSSKEKIKEKHKKRNMDNYYFTNEDGSITNEATYKEEKSKEKVVVKKEEKNNNSDKKDKEGGNKKEKKPRLTFTQRIEAALNNRYNNIVDFLKFAFNDMHACETYLSFMLSLEEDEAFSTLGYSQITLTGYDEAMVLSKSGEVLLKIIEGEVDYKSIKLPVMARSLLSNKAVIGVPSNIECTLYITNESLLDTASSISLERYSASGHPMYIGEKTLIYLRKDKMIRAEIGKKTYESDKLELERVTKVGAKKIVKVNKLAPEQKFRVSPLVNFDTDLNMETGVEVGSQIIYGIGKIGWNMETLDSMFNIIMGVGSRQTLSGPILIDLELLGKCLWTKKDLEKGEHEFNYVPQIKVSFSLRPAKHFSIFLACTFDIEADDINKGAFNKKVRPARLGSFPLSDKTACYPGVVFGLRF